MKPHEMQSLAFDKVQWPIRRDREGPRFYGGLSNEVSLLEGGEESTEPRSPIAIPTGLFKYLKEVIKAGSLEDSWLYVEKLERTLWVFGICHDGEMYDLWSYKVRPSWMKRRKV